MELTQLYHRYYNKDHHVRAKTGTLIPNIEKEERLALVTKDKRLWGLLPRVDGVRKICPSCYMNGEKLS